MDATRAGVKSRTYSRNASTPLAHSSRKALVLPAVLEDQMMKPERQGAVGPWTDRQMDIGLLGERGPARIDHDQVLARPMPNQGVRIEGRDGSARVGRPDEMATRLGRHHGGGGLDLVAEGHLLGHHGRREAAAALGQIVRRPEGVRQALQLGTRLLGVAREEADRRGTMGLLDPAQTHGDGVERLVPGDALEVTAPARSDALERIEDAVGMVAPVQLHITPRTIGALHTNRLTAFVKLDLNRAVGVTLVTGTGFPRHPG
jgi:hypothetical protein